MELYEVHFASPPCGIGQHLYALINGCIIKAEVCEIICHAEAENFGYFLRQRVIAHQADGTTHKIEFCEIGRKWFLTEAELIQSLERI